MKQNCCKPHASGNPPAQRPPLSQTRPLMYNKKNQIAHRYVERLQLKHTLSGVKAGLKTAPCCLLRSAVLPQCCSQVRLLTRGHHLGSHFCSARALQESKASLYLYMCVRKHDVQLGTLPRAKQFRTPDCQVKGCGNMGTNTALCRRLAEHLYRIVRMHAVSTALRPATTHHHHNPPVPHVRCQMVCTLLAGQQRWPGGLHKGSGPSVMIKGRSKQRSTKAAA